jgi:hypothetical protein
MSYSEAMEAAGAKVIEFKEFGSYQGDWWALVEWREDRGWVNGSYGSCSGCDAFEGEFSGTYDECEEHRWEWPKPESCSSCDEAVEDRKRRLAEFGGTYLTGGLMTQDEAEKQSLEYDWDSDSHEKTKEGEMTEFIKSHREAKNA